MLSPLQVLGGYTAACAGRVVNPTNTSLDGQTFRRVLPLQTSGPISPAISTGSASPFGRLPGQDLEAGARSFGTAPDMGAYGSNVLPVELQHFSIG